MPQNSQQNLSSEEFRSIQELNNNLGILILKVDKGNAFVIMNSLDYDSKLLDFFSSSSYKSLPKDHIKLITSMVTKAIKSSSLPSQIQKRLIPSHLVTPRIYEQ